MSLIFLTPILVIVIGVIIYSLVKGNSGLKIMIIGIQFSIIGLGIILINESNLTLIGFVSLLLGLLISTFGLVKRD
ncbi:hypothetical protein SAMN02799633_04212 [Bacillus sp. UNCCL81]|nr:hypothetical protein SAMN02799633_04212 [Bacillus sp. UNCCL81]